MSAVHAETHKVAAGSQFDGTVPTTDHDLDKGNLKYAEHTAGGLFKLPISRNEDKELQAAAALKRTRKVTGLRVVFGGQSSWSLSIVDGDGNEFVWLSGTTEADLVVTDSYELGPEDNLKLVTTGASTAMVATVSFDIGREAN